MGQGRSTSALADLLVAKWAWGVFSAPMVQQLAEAAEKDGNTTPQITKLAALGARGLYPGNCHADLQRQLRPTPVQVALTPMTVTVLRPPNGYWTGQHFALWPHELFAAIFAHHPKVFNDRLLGGNGGNLGHFWASMQGNPAYATHPVRDRAGHQSKAVPLSLHGDGVPVVGVGKAWSKSMDVYSWASMLSTGRTAENMFLIYLLNPKLCVTLPGKNMQEHFFKLLKWSLYWLFLGVWPRRDHNEAPYPAGSPEAARAGAPLANGYFGVLWCIKGDLEHMHKVYRLPRWDSPNPCGLCAANTSDRPWTDARPQAAWRATVWNNQTWRQEHPDHHPIFDLPGLGILAFVPDVMHTCHLGIYQHILGSTLEMLVTHILRGTPEQNMAKVWSMVQAYYKDIVFEPPPSSPHLTK